MRWASSRLLALLAARARARPGRRNSSPQALTRRSHSSPARGPADHRNTSLGWHERKPRRERAAARLGQGAHLQHTRRVCRSWRCPPKKALVLAKHHMSPRQHSPRARARWTGRESLGCWPPQQPPATPPRNRPLPGEARSGQVRTEQMACKLRRGGSAHAGTLVAAGRGAAGNARATDKQAGFGSRLRGAPLVRAAGAPCFEPLPLPCCRPSGVNSNANLQGAPPDEKRHQKERSKSFSSQGGGGIGRWPPRAPTKLTPGGCARARVRPAKAPATCFRSRGSRAVARLLHYAMGAQSAAARVPPRRQRLGSAEPRLHASIEGKAGCAAAPEFRWPRRRTGLGTFEPGAGTGPWA